MSLEDKISQDYVSAMKARDTFRSGVLSFLRAQIKNVKVDKHLESLPDEDVVAVIKKQAKQRQDSINQFKIGGRADLVEKEEKEWAILKSYFPQQLSVDQLTIIIDEVIKTTGASSIKDMGKVMKDIVSRLAGGADNQIVGAMVKERLTAK